MTRFAHSLCYVIVSLVEALGAAQLAQLQKEAVVEEEEEAVIQSCDGATPALEVEQR